MKKSRFPVTLLTSYENDFIKLCGERNWIVEKDEDDSPTLFPSRTKDRKIYKVAMYAEGIVSLVITAEHGRTKESLLLKVEKANLQGTCCIEGLTDAIYNFPLERLARAVKTLNLRRKQRHPGPPKEAIKKGQEALRKWRENQKKMGKTDENRV